MFIDNAKLDLKAGDGGDGCNSFERDQAGRKQRPDGGSGGKGGDIFLKVDNNVHTLLDFQYRRIFTAGRGGHASSNNKTGASGTDYLINIPAGTVIKDFKTGRQLADLLKPGQTFLACKGGIGGSGNSRHRLAGKGEEGEGRIVLLELKLIADVGIIGYPNAGKSTLVSRVTKAHPKIAGYPFTTKEPILGVARVGDFDFVIADIPGLIEGAHSGKGLGDKFLRHVERTKVLIHLIDMAGIDQRNPVEDYKRLNKELGLYSKALANKPQVIAANKMDVGKTAEASLKRFKAAFKKKKIIPISAKQGEGLKKVLSETSKILRRTQEECCKE